MHKRMIYIMEIYIYVHLGITLRLRYIARKILLVCRVYSHHRWCIRLFIANSNLQPHLSANLRPLVYSCMHTSADVRARAEGAIPYIVLNSRKK